MNLFNFLNFFNTSKRFCIAAFCIFFISIMSIIIFFKTGNLNIIIVAFKSITILGGSYLTAQTISDKVGEWITSKKDNNEK